MLRLPHVGVEAGVAAALAAAGAGLGDTTGAGLGGTIGAFTRAVADTFAEHGRTFPVLLSSQPGSAAERGLRALDTVQRALVEAAEPYLADVARPDARAAVRFAARTIIGSCVHRAATVRTWPDGLTWPQWATATSELALAHLSAS